jgi:hypothetical protein
LTCSNSSTLRGRRHRGLTTTLSAAAAIDFAAPAGHDNRMSSPFVSRFFPTRFLPTMSTVSHV